METILLDLRYCFRMLRKRPGFTIIAVITLALGIGASTAIFSVVNVVVLNPFPYRNPSQLSLVRQRLPKLGVTDGLRSSGPEFVDLAQSGIFEGVAAWEGVSRNLTGGEEPERIAASKVSTEFSSMLGVEPVLGRVISPEEQGPGGDRVLVIGHALWQRRFGGDLEVVGQTVFLDDEPYTIIGVMPPRFRFDGAEAWFPCLFDFGQSPRSARTFAVLTRLKPGISTAQTEAELEVLARQHEQAYGAGTPEYEGRGLYLQSIAEFYFRTVRTALFILLGAVALVLLISCANVANLLLARSMSRSREIAIRAAMGASRLRIVRQLLTESMVLGVLGGASGLLLAAWGTDGLVALIPPGTLPPGLEVRIDSRVLLFALAISLLTALIFGSGPAFQIARSHVQESLKSGGERATAGRGQRRAQRLLVIAEVSLALIVLVMAGLMVQSFANLMNVDPGLRTERLLTMRINDCH
jgi:putative ABC transport system permease protein